MDWMRYRVHGCNEAGLLFVWADVEAGNELDAIKELQRAHAEWLERTPQPRDRLIWTVSPLWKHRKRLRVWKREPEITWSWMYDAWGIHDH